MSDFCKWILSVGDKRIRDFVGNLGRWFIFLSFLLIHFFLFKILSMKSYPDTFICKIIKLQETETLNQPWRISFHLITNDGQISLRKTIAAAILGASTLQKTTFLKQQKDPNTLCLQQHKRSRANSLIFLVKYPAEMTVLLCQMFLRSYHRIASTRHIYLKQTLSSLRATFSWNSLNTWQTSVLFYKGT